MKRRHDESAETDATEFADDREEERTRDDGDVEFDDIDLEADDYDDALDDDVGENEGPGHVDRVRPAAEDDDSPEALQDRHLRLAAEFDNYRKRTRRELLQAREAAKASLAGQLLDVLDDLGRVADLEPETTTVEALDEGIELVERKLHKALADAGLVRIEPEGEKFDPNYHEALMSVPTDDPGQDGLVAQLLMVGYRFGERLLRPARVSVYSYESE